MAQSLPGNGSFPTYDLVCIGCGPAGEKAATQAAYFKKRVAIVERQASPGGAMVNTGTIPSKALRETALLCSAFNRRPMPGTEISINHGMSVAKFMARRHLIEYQEHDRIESSIDRHGIDVFRGHGRIVDANTISITGEDGSERRISTKHILICTGSSPVRPKHIPFEFPGVVDADGVLEMPRIPRSMVIVGAGVIGCEYASIFAEIDVQVTLVNPRPDVLPFLDAACRTQLLESMKNRGVDLRFGSTVRSVAPQDDLTVLVTLENGESITADVLLWAAGRQSNTKDIGLENVGIATDERGLVKVNEKYQTSVGNIWAAGDVIGFPALAATSMEQGRIAACHMFGIAFKQKLADLMPIGIYTIPAISMVGPTAEEAAKKGMDVVTGTAQYRYNVRGRMLGDETGMLKCVFDRKTRALVGASIIGEDATELIHQAQAAISHGAGIEYFIATCYNYPSLSELYKYAAYSALQEIARINEPVKQAA